VQSNDIPYRDYDHAAKMAAGYAFSIDTEARWTCHDPAMGVGPIRREAIARLFSGAGRGFMAGKGLSVDDQGIYWLKSPPDSYKVDVEDVPFLMTDFEKQSDVLILKTNFDEPVTLGQGTEFIFRPDGPFPETPYVHVRAGLLGRLSRAVFYNLAGMATEYEGTLAVQSAGNWHKLSPRIAA
jgi:hypothetical protein